MSRKTVEQARNNYASSKSRMLTRDDALGEAARRGQETAGTPHANVLGWFSIRPSPLHGLGVFAERRYRAGQPIVMGIGKIMKQGDSTPSYSFEMAGAGLTYRHLAFDCMHGNTIKLFNSGGSSNANAEVFWHGSVPVVYATRTILKGVEILLGYGVQ